MIEAIYKAHEVNGQIIEFFDKIVAECGKEKHEYEHFDIPEDMYEDMVSFVTPEAMEEAVFTDVKQVREENIRKIKDQLEDCPQGDPEGSQTSGRPGGDTDPSPGGRD